MNCCCSFSALGEWIGKKSPEKDEKVNRKRKKTNSGHALEEADIDQTLKTMKIEDNWQGDVMDYILQGQLKIMKDKKLWVDDKMNANCKLESSSDCSDMVEEVEKVFKSICRFCGVVFESKVELVEHVAMICTSLKRVKNVDEVLTDVEERLQKPQRKRGQQKKKFSTPTEKVVKKATSYTCFNEECGAKFDSQDLYVAHLHQCVMTYDYKRHERCIKTVDNMLVYDPPRDTEGFDNEASGSISADDSAPLKVFAILCPHDGKTRRRQKKVYQCTHCSVAAIRCKMLRHIIKVHLKTKCFCCNKCPLKYAYFDTFKDHYVSRHTSLTYRCPEENCNEVFIKQQALSKHILLEHKRQGKRFYLCKDCGKTFKRSNHARRHERYHRVEDRTNICNLCCKAFATKQDLERHMHTHTGTKPYKCSQCDFSSIRRFNMILHERRHGMMHGEYSCHACGKHFVAVGNLKAHIKNKHENPAQVLAKSLPTQMIKMANEMSVADMQPVVTDDMDGSDREQVLSTETIPYSSELTSDSLQGNQVLDGHLSVSDELEGSGICVSDEIDTLENVQEVISDETGSNLVYILTNGEPYDYTVVDSSMLNTT